MQTRMTKSETEDRRILELRVGPDLDSNKIVLIAKMPTSRGN